MERIKKDYENFDERSIKPLEVPSKEAALAREAKQNGRRQEGEDMAQEPDEERPRPNLATKPELEAPREKSAEDDECSDPEEDCQQPRRSRRLKGAKPEFGLMSK